MCRPARPSLPRLLRSRWPAGNNTDVIVTETAAAPRVTGARLGCHPHAGSDQRASSCSYADNWALAIPGTAAAAAYPESFVCLVLGNWRMITGSWLMRRQGPPLEVSSAIQPTAVR